MAVNPNQPPGRPPRYVKGRDAKPIIGLSKNKSDGRYYATHSKPLKRFGRDFDTAVMRFRAWQAQQRNEKVILRVPGPIIREEDQEESVAEGWITAEQASRLVPWPEPVSSEAFFAKARELILEDPGAFASGVGIPEIGYLQDLKPPQPSPKLTSLLKTYTDKAEVTRHERQKSERYWAEFRQFITANTVREVTQEQVADYHDWVMQRFSKGCSQTWAAHRFGKIKTIFNFAASRGIAPAEVAKVLAFCKMLKPPRKRSADPHPVSRENFHALLEVADAKWKAILLCMLNGALYAKEVGDLLKKEVDLGRGTLVTDRSKTGVVRIAVLWERTIEAIKAAPRHPQHPYVFQNMAGTKYHPDHIRRGFTRLRQAAGVSAEVKVSDIRDGSYTAAIEGGADANHAMLLAGHATGMKDAYVRRNPAMVADACEAIQVHYFG